MSSSQHSANNMASPVTQDDSIVGPTLTLGPRSHLIRPGKAAMSRRAGSTYQIAGAIYAWTTCLFVAIMVCSQFFGVISSSVDSTMTVTYGNDPTLGTYDTGKTNDVPYSDRLVACLRKDEMYSPTQLTELLDSPIASVLSKSSPGALLGGFRVIERYGLKLDSDALEFYSHVCDEVSLSLDTIYTTCQALGYNPITDGLRIVLGTNSNDTVLLRDVLPVLILPFWDNAVYVQFLIPGWDGSACTFRLGGKYINKDSSLARISGMTRTIRESKTVEWLHQSGGDWRHGWYESRSDKWYSFMWNSDPTSELLPTARFFDGLTSAELDCKVDTCNDDVVVSRWGSRFSISSRIPRATSIVVYNTSQFGIFLYNGTSSMSLSSVYDWQMAISNACIAQLIFRWVVGIIALQRGYIQRKSALHHIGIGALSNTPSFCYLPILLLPRLDMILSAFFSVGCAFQGQQLAFSDTWFAIYPAIIELMLVYYSLINFVAKILRRRVTDALFAPTVFTLALVHYFRQDIAEIPWFGIKDRWIQTLVSSNEIEKMKLYQFFTTDIAVRLNGGIVKLFALKLAFLGLSLIPVIIAPTLPTHPNVGVKLTGIEKALAIRASNVAGLGNSRVYETLRDGSLVAEPASARALLTKSATLVYPTRGRLALNSYELVRLGYIVYGGKYLLSFEDWDRVSMLSGFRSLYHLWNHRVIVFRLIAPELCASFPQINDHLQLMRVDEPELMRVHIWDIAACAIRC